MWAAAGRIAIAYRAAPCSPVQRLRSRQSPPWSRKRRRRWSSAGRPPSIRTGRRATSVARAALTSNRRMHANSSKAKSARMAGASCLLRRRSGTGRPVLPSRRRAPIKSPDRVVSKYPAGAKSLKDAQTLHAWTAGMEASPRYQRVSVLRCARAALNLPSGGFGCVNRN